MTEEKRKQKKEWKKRKCEAKRAMSETAEKIANGVTAKPRDQKKTASVSQKPTHPSPQNGNDQMFASVISSALKDPEK